MVSEYEFPNPTYNLALTMVSESEFLNPIYNFIHIAQHNSGLDRDYDIDSSIDYGF